MIAEISGADLATITTQLAIIIVAILGYLKLGRMAKTGETTHALVNSQSLAQMMLVAQLSRWKADQGNNPDHIKAAEDAEKLYVEHAAKQAALDEAAK